MITIEIRFDEDQRSGAFNSYQTNVMEIGGMIVAKDDYKLRVFLPKH